METDITRPAQSPHMPLHTSGRRPQPSRRWMVIAVVAVVVIVLGLGCGIAFGRRSDFSENKNVNTSEYQAIFLTNGQVYFGKLADLGHRYVTIKDIYYLQVQQGQTDSSKSLQNASSSADTNAQVSLAKLGSELHGPEDKMYISSDQVLFWENLKPSGKVTQAIDAYQKNN